MSIRILLAALLVSSSLPALGDYVLVSKAYEAEFSGLRLPGTVNGTVTFKECKDCDYQTIRVTAGTQYELNGQAVSLEELRKQLENVSHSSDVRVTVLHHLESDTVKAVRVWF